MTDEQIKEITIAIIERGWLTIGDSSEGMAEEVAKFINKLREKVNQ